MSKLFAMPGLDAKLLTCRSVALLTDRSIRGLAVGPCQETEGERDGEELHVLVEPQLPGVESAKVVYKPEVTNSR